MMFQTFAPYFPYIFKFSRPKGRENLFFSAAKLVKIYFCAKKFSRFFFHASNNGHFAQCAPAGATAK